MGRSGYPDRVSNARSNLSVGVEPTSSWPSPAQDYYDGPLDLTRALVRNEAATFALRYTGAGLDDIGIRPGDVLLVDRSLAARAGRVIVVEVEPGERHVGRLTTDAGHAVLLTGSAQYRLTTDTLYWGAVTVIIRQLGPASR